MLRAPGEGFSRRRVSLRAHSAGSKLLPMCVLYLIHRCCQSLQLRSDIEASVRREQASDVPDPVAHIINVPGLKGARRREHVRIEFQKARYPYVLISAQRPTHANGTERTTGTNGLTLGEISLMQAHSRLYAQLLASEERFMLIGEDDISLCDDFANRVRTVLRNLPPNFDAVKLEYGNKSPKRFASLAREMISKLKIVQGMGGCCTGLYITSRTGAELFLRENPPFEPVQTSDGILDPAHVLSRDIVLLHVVPPLAWQDKSSFVQSSGSHRDLGSS